MRPLTLAAFALAAFALAACGSGREHARHGAIEVHTLIEDYANVHVVRVGGHTLIVDAGLERNGPAYVEQLRALGIERADAVVLTHGHADHAGGAPALRSATGARLVAARPDAPLISTGESGTLCPTDFIARSRVDDDRAERYTPYPVDVWLDGPADLAPIAGVPGRVVPVPGHTDGSVVIVVGELAFVGDLLRGSVVGSSAEVHFYQCDLEDNRQAIARLLAEFPEVTTVYPGHFGPLDRADVLDLLARWPTPDPG